MKNGITTLALISMAMTPSAVRAQVHVVAAAKCDRIDTTAAWYRKQAQWWALEAKHDWTNDSLRTALLGVFRLIEPSTRDPFPIQFGATAGAPAATEQGDALRGQLPAIRQFLRDMAAKRQWPLRSTVGPAGVRAAWMIAAGDSALTDMAMHRMMEAGPGEVSPTDVAVLEDWMRLKTGRKQIYGAQLQPESIQGKTRLQAMPTEDLAHVNLRRDAAGLPPMTVALCLAGRGAK